MLTAPNLDDRRFQDLVDDAKRLVQRRCPTWTDHNVSDPGVTLIEAFAQMTDQLIYRLNRVPDLHYIKFLELIGVELRPPAAARGEVTFWLSAPQPQPVLVRAETQVATPRTDVGDPVVFSTTRDLVVVPCSLAHAAAQAPGEPPVDRTTALGRGGFACFSATPRVGDSLLIGLSDAVPSCAVLLRLDCTVSGRGVDPRRPPVVWEALTADGWQTCAVDRDETGGLNRPGDVVLHVPDGHQASILGAQRGGWLRCRVDTAVEGPPTYSASPVVVSATAVTVGGTVPTVHAEIVRHEVLGRSDGTAAQRFEVQRRPVVPADAPATLVAVAPDGTETTWRQVAHFARSGPTDRHFRLDAYAGEVQLGPAVRGAAGELICYGAIPPAGAALRLQDYRTGGGQVGNVSRGQVRVLKTSVPYVARVENRVAAVGGAEAESLEDAKARGPLLLRSRGRAVTAEDFEELARDVAPEVARVHCVAEPDERAGVRLLVVPYVTGDHLGRIPLEDLQPPRDALQRISTSLDRQRLVGTRLQVQPPDYVGLTAVVSLVARPGFDPAEVRLDVLRALYRLYHPLVGGPERTGWPVGRTVATHEVHATLAAIPGVDMTREVRVQLFPADPATRQRSAATDRIDLPPTGLVYSFDHQVRVAKAEGRP
jgi:predicted phage baseplate assembly protein